MGKHNKIYDDYLYFLTMTIVDWIDIFTRPLYKHLIIESFKYCQKEKGLILHAWVIMTNHIHLIASAKEGYHLSNILRDFKKHTSKKIIDLIKTENESRRKWMLERFYLAGKENPKIKEYKVWQEGNEAKELHTNYFLDQKLNYIHNNPVNAEWVEKPEDYLYSSARDYCEIKGLLEIIRVD